MALSNTKPLPEWEELLDRYEYLPQSGELVFKALPQSYFSSSRLMNSYNAKFAGKMVGGRESQGYTQVRIGDEGYKRHRLIWKWVTGDDPDKYIDHLDGDRGNDRFENLRDGVDHTLNACNQKLARHNTSGNVGVHYARGKWVARGSYKGERVYLGVFDDYDAACEARATWQLDLPFTETHGTIRKQYQTH